jgi:hypothetical protein
MKPQFGVRLTKSEAWRRTAAGMGSFSVTFSQGGTKSLFVNALLVHGAGAMEAWAGIVPQIGGV